MFPQAKDKSSKGIFCQQNNIQINDQEIFWIRLRCQLCNGAPRFIKREKYWVVRAVDAPINKINLTSIVFSPKA